MRKKILLFFAASILFTSCGIYDKYEPKGTVSADAFGSTQDVNAAKGDVSLAQMSWREFFTDPLLQQLIEQVLANNVDLNSARIAVEKSETSLKAAKMAYLPSLYFSPQGTLASFDNSALSKTYNLPLQLSMDIDVFGSITNKKRAAKAVLLQTELRQQAVCSNLVSAVAQQYYMLLLLDRQMEILTQTDSLWNASLETQKILYENGKAYSTAVNQLESSYLSVKTQLVDIRRSIRATENALCKLLGISPQHIQRSHWQAAAQYHTSSAHQHMFDSSFLKIGIPATLLELRPDIRMANAAMEEAFYNTQAARAAFYPSITLTAQGGWTNSAGSMIVDPAKMFFNLVGSLTQPIFMRGALTANLKVSKMKYEQAFNTWQNSILQAGNEVSNALVNYNGYDENSKLEKERIEILTKNVEDTRSLYQNSGASYLEVLTAQSQLLSAQLTKITDDFNKMQAVVSLYTALGGGGK